MGWWIEHLGEPTRLILEWRPPEDVPDRARWAVGELRRAGERAGFRYLRGPELAAANRGRGAEALRAAGFRGYPAFPWEGPGAQEMFHDGALEAFLRRLPSPRREDFPRYLERFLLRPRPGLSGFALLAATGASLPHDGFSLVDPLDGEAELQDVVLEANGYRHYAAALGRAPDMGAEVRLAREPSNEHDPYAVRIELDGHTIGYVSRLQSSAVSRWVERDAARAWVARLNGSPPHPRAFVLAQVRANVLEPAA